MDSSEEEVMNIRKRKIVARDNESENNSQEKEPVQNNNQSFKKEEKPKRQKKTRIISEPSEKFNNKKKKTEIADQEKYVSDIIELMKDLYKKDINSLKQSKPSTQKIDAMDSLYDKIIKKEVQEACIKMGVLDELKIWLEPLPDNSLPNPKIKRAILDLLYNMKLDKGDLLKSGIGKIVHFYSKNNRESKEIRVKAAGIIKKWKNLVLKEEIEDE